MTDAEKFKTECRELIDSFCKQAPQHRPLAPRAKRMVGMLTGADISLEGCPGGWAGGVIHALTQVQCGVPGVLNADMEKIFNASMGTIRKRSAKIRDLFSCVPVP